MVPLLFQIHNLAHPHLGHPGIAASNLLRRLLCIARLGTGGTWCVPPTVRLRDGFLAARATRPSSSTPLPERLQSGR